MKKYSHQEMLVLAREKYISKMMTATHYRDRDAAIKNSYLILGFEIAKPPKSYYRQFIMEGYSFQLMETRYLYLSVLDMSNLLFRNAFAPEQNINWVYSIL